MAYPQPEQYPSPCPKCGGYTVLRWVVPALEDGKVVVLVKCECEHVRARYYRKDRKVISE